MTDPETFWSLLHNAAHWEFEIFLMVVFDGIVGALLYPWASKHIKHHWLCDRRELIAPGEWNRKSAEPPKYDWRGKAAAVNPFGTPPIRKTRQIFQYDDIVAAYSTTPPTSEEFNQLPKGKFDWSSDYLRERQNHEAALKLRQSRLPVYVQMTDEEIIRLCTALDG